MSLKLFAIACFAVATTSAIPFFGRSCDEVGSVCVRKQDCRLEFVPPIPYACGDYPSDYVCCAILENKEEKAIEVPELKPTPRCAGGWGYCSKHCPDIMSMRVLERWNSECADFEICCSMSSF